MSSSRWTKAERRKRRNGHCATKTTQEIILREHWFNKIREKSNNVIQNCVQCTLCERKFGKQEGLLNPIDKVDIPLSTIYIYHWGPLPSTKKDTNTF